MRSISISTLYKISCSFLIIVAGIVLTVGSSWIFYAYWTIEIAIKPNDWWVKGILCPIEEEETEERKAKVESVKIDKSGGREKRVAVQEGK